ncbi:uncharacterized protein LOC110176648 isoform X1 [Drosophila serrata]|uniref:uncharacterized protein LOC110176648 isoform X1 n=1 Tax=Drosophila serrata TaxID=7274 RepID=UPI000A1D2909|nr:uncharacterized protein LOC110176648 isoform X1 [Drosophila serrata]KAH8361951.1 hypothetical protein KR200_012158 [Drosophila serrata]
MSSARFARSGRVRICILMSMFIVLIMMIVIYQMSQHQLDESRAFQEGLNVQMQSLTADKVTAEKRMSLLRTEKMSLQEKYEGQLAEAVQKQQEIERALQEKFDAQLEKYKLLEGKYSDLEAECLKSKKKHIEDTNAFDQKLQKLLADVHKDKASKEQEVSAWKDKLEKLHRDSEHKIHALEATISEFKANCQYVPKVQPAEAPAHGHQQQLNKPGDLTPTTRNSSPAQLAHSIEKPRNEKSFDAQVQVSDGVYRIGGGVNLTTNPKQNQTYSTTNTTIKSNGGGAKDKAQRPEQEPLLTFAVRNNHSLIINSVENFQIVPEKQQQEEPQLSGGPISPLSAPRKSSTQSSAGELAVKSAGEAPNASVAPKVSSSGLPPLAKPPAKAERKLPENVAPIPENFYENKMDGKGDAGDIDTAAEELPKNENNIRYANAVNDLENTKNLGVAPKPNEDSGAHEVKDALNEPSFNLPAAGGQNFFDGDLPAPGPGPVPDEPAKQMAEAVGAVGGGEGDDDDDVGDVAVKQPQHLLDTDNLNNEIVADQGKEFAEGGIHLEDGLDEDQDEDDYSNVAARKKGGEAIRH